MTDQSRDVYRPTFTLFDLFEKKISESFSLDEVELFIRMMRRAINSDEGQS